MRSLRISALGLMESKVEDARAKGGKVSGLKTRGRSFGVLLEQDPKVKTLGERGSPWCR
jgi:hypothetical protein